MAFDVRQYYRTPCNAFTPVIKAAQGQRHVEQLTLTTDDGITVNFDEIGLRTDAGSSSSASNGLVAKLAYGTTYADVPLFEVDLEIKQDGDNDIGLVQITLEPEQSINSGLFVGSIGVFRDGVLVFSRSVMVQFAPNSFNIASCGMLTIAEVRMELMDTCSGANYLLDELEFTDAEIVHAIKKAVDMYNAQPPPIGGYTYDAFPYRGPWLKGTTAYLLQSIGHRYRRNALSYSAGGITIADQEKSQEYTAVGARLEAEFLDWAKTTRVAANIGRGYGTIGASSYRWSSK